MQDKPNEYNAGLTSPVVEISQLKAGYKNKCVLADISLILQNGKVTGLLGPNGAGKSTLLMVLATLLKPMGGSVKVTGYDVRNGKQRRMARRNLTFLPQDFSVDEKLTVEECIYYSLWLREYPKTGLREAIDEALAFGDLTDSRRVRIQDLSGGLRQRVGLASVCAGSPPLIILDEPTVGLDPEQRIHFRRVLRQMSDKGSAVILSTHIVEDVIAVAEDLVVLNEGEIAYTGSSSVLTPHGDLGIDSVEEAYKNVLSSREV